MSKKGRAIPINTLDDLTNLVNHNFRAFDKRITKMTRRNRNVMAFVIVAMGLTILSEVERRKQEEQIYQLSVRVKKLEYNEGE